jgi:hypothetical protein
MPRCGVAIVTNKFKRNLCGYSQGIIALTMTPPSEKPMKIMLLKVGDRAKNVINSRAAFYPSSLIVD